MLGKHHITITLFLLFPLIYSFYSKIYLALFFVLLGSIVPDIDANNSIFKHGVFKNKLRKIIKFLYILLKYVFYYPYAFILSLVYKDALKHRKSMHSLFPSIFLTVILYVILLNFHMNIYSLCFLLGYILHLIEDSFTYSGICFLYPFGFCLKGRLKTNSFFTSIICNLISMILLIPIVAFFERISFGLFIFNHPIEYVILVISIMGIFFWKF